MSADLPPEREVSHCCRRQQNFILCDMFTLACKTAFSDLSQTRIMSGCHISYFCFGPLMVHWLAGLNYNVDSWADIRLWCATLSHGVMASVFFFRNLFFCWRWCLLMPHILYRESALFQKLFYIQILDLEDGPQYILFILLQSWSVPNTFKVKTVRMFTKSLFI